MLQFYSSTLDRFERQRSFMAVAPRVLPIDKQFPTHSKADVKATRNQLYLYHKGVLPGFEPKFTHFDQDGEAVTTKPEFNLSPRQATVISNDNQRRDIRKTELRMLRRANLLILNPTIER